MVVRRNVEPGRRIESCRRSKVDLYCVSVRRDEDTSWPPSSFERGALRTEEKKLLMICYCYPPMYAGGVERSEKFVRHLPEHG